MKRLYTNFRIVLMTFALGLASVFMTSGSLEFYEVAVNLPQLSSESPVVVIPVESKNISLNFGGGGSGTCSRGNFQMKKSKKIDSDFKSNGSENFKSNGSEK